MDKDGNQLLDVAEIKDFFNLKDENSNKKLELIMQEVDLN